MKAMVAEEERGVVVVVVKECYFVELVKVVNSGR